MALMDIRLNKKAQDALVALVRAMQQMHQSHTDQRSYMEYVDQDYLRVYSREAKDLKAEIAMRNASPTLFRNIIYPVVMPAVESATTYQVSVFCTGNPIFGVVSPPQYAGAALQLESTIDSQAQRGAWGVEFGKMFRAGFKYNIAGASCDWTAKYAPMNGNVGSEDAQRKPIWEGNVVKSYDMYNTFYDGRVPPAQVAEDGEFIGDIRRLPAMALKSLMLGLSSKLIANFNAALASTNQTPKFYIPKLGNSLYGKLVSWENNWDGWLGLSGNQELSALASKYGGSYEVVKVFVRICPRDFGIDAPAANTPQIWRLILVNWSVLIHAEPVETEDGMLPGMLYEAQEDDLGSHTQSLAELTVPFQQLATAYVNSGVAARRRSIADRGIYNQSIIDSNHINNDSPTAKIPMKPSALLSAKPSDAYYAIPFNDNISGAALQEAEFIAGMAQKLTRQNPAKQGQFVKGNKTTSEFDSVMQNSNAADQATSLHIEERIFMPLKRRLKYNVMQKQGAATMFSRSKNTAVQVSPQEMQEAVMAFKISDGLTPSSKLAGSDMLQVMMQTVPQVPELAQEYSIANIFGGLMQAGGVDIRDYKFDAATIQYKQQLQTWQQTALEYAKIGREFTVPMPTPPGQGQQTQAPQQGVQ